MFSFVNSTWKPISTPPNLDINTDTEDEYILVKVPHNFDTFQLNTLATSSMIPEPVSTVHILGQRHGGFASLGLPVASYRLVSEEQGPNEPAIKRTPKRRLVPPDRRLFGASPDPSVSASPKKSRRRDSTEGKKKKKKKSKD